MKREKNKTLFYSALQSEFGRAALKQFNLEGKIDSVVLIENGKAFIKSGAALRCTKYMKGLWPLMMVFLIVPGFIRNWVYDYVSSNRITWFGTADYCEMMTPDLKERFLD